MQRSADCSTFVTAAATRAHPTPRPAPQIPATHPMRPFVTLAFHLPLRHETAHSGLTVAPYRHGMLLCKHPDAQLSRVQPQPLHGQIAYKRCIGHVHVEPGERSLVHTHVRRGVRPNGGRDSLQLTRSMPSGIEIQARFPILDAEYAGGSRASSSLLIAAVPVGRHSFVLASPSTTAADADTTAASAVPSSALIARRSSPSRAALCGSVSIGIRAPRREPLQQLTQPLILMPELFALAWGAASRYGTGRGGDRHCPEQENGRQQPHRYLSPIMSESCCRPTERQTPNAMNRITDPKSRQLLIDHAAQSPAMFRV